ncbi:MAG: type II secretion system protein, partial [Acidimicrobiia bacterium]
MTRRVRFLTPEDSGYTLIEMVTVAAVLMFVLAASLPFLYGQLNQTAITQSRIESVQQARNALREMARELRQAERLVHEVGRLTTNGRVQSGSNNDEISFETDRDYNNVINSCTNPALPAECVTYYRSFAGFGLDLIRGRNNTSGEKVATNVTDLKLTFYGNCPRRDLTGDGWI